jgi:stringent starvation protein B
VSEQSAKPYIIRALYEWCVDQGYTPFMAVRVNANTKVPVDYVQNGEIVLNVGPMATHKLTMDNEWTLFNARFNGVTQEIAIPFAAVVGIFAKETGYGMGFQPDLQEPHPAVTNSLVDVAQSSATPSLSPISGSAATPADKPAAKGKASLKVVK